KENELGFVQITDFRKVLVQFRQQPKQENRVQAWRLHQPVSRKNVDYATAGGVSADKVKNIQHGFAEEVIGTLAFQPQQSPLNGHHRGRRVIPIAGAQLRGAVAYRLQHGAQILEVKQQQAFLVGHSEDNVQNAFLRIVQFEHAGQQEWAHIGNRCTQRVALGA